jgi:hypothetical protein
MAMRIGSTFTMVSLRHGLISVGKALLVFVTINLASSPQHLSLHAFISALVGIELTRFFPVVHATTNSSGPCLNFFIHNHAKIERIAQQPMLARTTGRAPH